MAKKTRNRARTVPVTMRALIQRINRALLKNDEKLKATRGGRMQTDYGDYYTLDFRLNAVIRGDVDPEELGRELGVLRPYEHVATE